MRRFRRAVGMLVVGGLLGSLMIVMNVATAEQAEAVDYSGFRPGRIISDSQFYNGAAMNASQIQSFVEQKVPSCPSGSLCLRDYRQSTTSRAADEACAAYSGASNETAAQIIAKVANACGISPKVILVMLEKEQRLVTRTDATSSSWAWKASMGYACPDSGPGGSANCDSQYYGFFNQVYHGARQLKRYGISPTFSWFPVGRTSQIQYHPNTGCGTKSVYIENKATAALYYYTPYTPNDAALAAGYGTGNSCSSYGNRNFYGFFSDWFGDPNAALTRGAIGVKYDALGGFRSKLGAPLAPELCGIKDNGCYQGFQNGVITWTSKAGAWPTWGAIRDRWKALDFERGPLGFPVSDEHCGSNGGCYQMYEGGAIDWVPGSGAWETHGAIRTRWSALGYDRGALGSPASGEICGLPGGGCYQAFQRGVISWKGSTGAWETLGAIRARFAATGFESGALGFPTSGETCGLAQNGCKQTFEGGAITWTPRIGAWDVRGEFNGVWAKAKAEAGPLGYPTGASACTDGLCVQAFQGGTVLKDGSAPVRSVWGGIHAAWTANGGANGKLGLPISDERAEAGKVVQDFEHGRIVWSPSEVTVVVG